MCTRDRDRGRLDGGRSVGPAGRNSDREEPRGPGEPGPVLVAGRKADRLQQRPRRRLGDLRDGLRRQAADAADAEPRGRRAPRLVARRQPDCLPQRPGRSAPDLRDERRRKLPDAADARPGCGLEPGLVTRRSQHRLHEQPGWREPDRRHRCRRERPARAHVAAPQRRPPRASGVVAGRAQDRLYWRPGGRGVRLRRQRRRQRPASAHRKRRGLPAGVVTRWNEHRLRELARRRRRALRDGSGRHGRAAVVRVRFGRVVASTLPRPDEGRLRE
jgi:hypothetical protein